MPRKKARLTMNTPTREAWSGLPKVEGRELTRDDRVKIDAEPDEALRTLLKKRPTPSE